MPDADFSAYETTHEWLRGGRPSRLAEPPADDPAHAVALLVANPHSALHVLARLLRRFHVPVLTTAHVAEATDVLAASAPAIGLVVVDAVLSDADGAAWVADVAQRYPRVAALLLSSNGRMLDLSPPALTGVPVLLTDSLTASDLRLAIPRAMDRHRLHAENRQLRATAARQALELHELRQRGAPILDALPQGIIGLDVDGRITLANPAALAMLGYELDELRGQPIRTHIQLTSADSPQPELSGLALAVPGVNSYVSGEGVCWHSAGTNFPIECASAPIVEDGRIVGAVVTFIDITEERQREQFKDELISVVSHELRTPLTSIRSSIGLLTSGLVGTLPPTGQRMLEIAVTNTDRLIRLINDILDLERVDSGKVNMQRVECDVADLMRHAADGVRAMAERSGVVIAVRACDCQVVGDPDRLLQVLVNLLSNAIKFSPDGGTVWLEAEQTADEVILRVRDEGRGIPADKLESVFERFKQVHASDARDKGGTGLGLAICRGIVKQHEGQIWAESTVGSGTTMCVALPGGASLSLRAAA
jgi:PAS domain S-box-containing protein